MAHKRLFLIIIETRLKLDYDDRTWLVQVNSTAAKGCFWEMTPTGSITRYDLFFLIEDPLGYVESVVVEKLIWSRL